MKAASTAVLTVAALAACTSNPAPTAGITIERMVVIADGDHAASTYVDGALARPGLRDQLITLNVVDGQVNTAAVEVPNSVTAADRP
ncbi:MAG: hypothetical protein ACSLE6_03300 [Mycobacterium sp.]